MYRYLTINQLNKGTLYTYSCRLVGGWHRDRVSARAGKGGLGDSRAGPGWAGVTTRTGCGQGRSGRGWAGVMAPTRRAELGPGWAGATTRTGRGDSHTL